MMKKGALQQSGASAGLMCVCPACADVRRHSRCVREDSAVGSYAGQESCGNDQRMRGHSGIATGQVGTAQHDGDLPDVDETSMPGELEADGMMRKERAHCDTEGAQTTKRERAPCRQQRMIEGRLLQRGSESS
jgi:hypothetical protein